ncbi:MAG: hypothetical protein IT463_10510 [Planctomycetes bacterium]|nr:hypothetical protein [Planctomycetota bacterium]
MKPHMLPLLVVVVLSLTGSSVAAPRKKKDEDKKDTWTSPRRITTARGDLIRSVDRSGALCLRAT